MILKGYLIFIDKYIEAMLKGFSIETCKRDPLSSQAQVYAKLCTRLSISCCESHEQILVEPRLEALDYCENISKYLSSTKRLFFVFEEGLELRVGECTVLMVEYLHQYVFLSYVGSVCWKSSRESTNESGICYKCTGYILLIMIVAKLNVIPLDAMTLYFKDNGL